MHFKKLLFLFSFLLLIPIVLSAQSVEITTPDSTVLMVGDSLELTAIYSDSSGNPVDTTFTWYVYPDSLGHIADSIFYAKRPGKGFISTSIHLSRDSIFIIVMEKDKVMPIAGHLKIIPPDTTIQVGNLVQFNAQFVDTHDVAHDTSAAWFVKSDLIGPISEEGLLFAFFPGKANIMAKLDTMTAKASLSVVDTTSDSTGINKIKIVRIFPNGKEKKPKTIKEGERYVIGGIPHPFNIINGGIVYFPVGSLHEDITLEIKLPKVAKIKKDSVEFVNEIVNGIQFDVFVNDSLIEPYYFGKPVSVAIPFKRGILKKYGIDAKNLDMFFAMDSVIFDSLGISHVMVDSNENRIFGLVEHFSSLVVRENKGVTSIKPEEDNITPRSFVLKQNYPNPFNPITTIEFDIFNENFVTLTIYNSAGQKIESLLSGNLKAGSYKYQWNAINLSSGIYFYQLKVGQSKQSKKMILLQ